jgi:hypothetical protein
MHPHSPAQIYAERLGATPERAVKLGAADTQSAILTGFRCEGDEVLRPAGFST